MGRLSSDQNEPEEKNKALDAWQASARYWDKYRVLIAQMFAPLTSGLVEEARIGIGQKVLDIGGGSGEPSLTISGIVGPTGSVTYTDPVAGMVETTQAEAGRRGLTNIHFRQCSADDLPFEDRAFDVAVSRLSGMFFVDPVTGVGEALRVIVENGCVSFVVWGPKEANPFFSTVTDVIDRFVESPTEDPDAPMHSVLPFPVSWLESEKTPVPKLLSNVGWIFRLKPHCHLSSSGNCGLKCPRVYAKKWLA